MLTMGPPRLIRSQEGQNMVELDSTCSYVPQYANSQSLGTVAKSSCASEYQTGEAISVLALLGDGYHGRNCPISKWVFSSYGRKRK